MECTIKLPPYITKFLMNNIIMDLTTVAISNGFYLKKDNCNGLILYNKNNIMVGRIIPELNGVHFNIQTLCYNDKYIAIATKYKNDVYIIKINCCKKIKIIKDVMNYGVIRNM